MAVGRIEHCDVCGKSYDSGRGWHTADCDGGAAIAAEKKALFEFNSKSVNERLEILFLELRALQDKVDNVPYYGPIG